MTTSSASHGHSGSPSFPITSSTIFRATSGTTAWPKLPRTAAAKEIRTLRLWRHTCLVSLRIHPGVSAGWSWLADKCWRESSRRRWRPKRAEQSLVRTWSHTLAGWTEPVATPGVCCRTVGSSSTGMVAIRAGVR